MGEMQIKITTPADTSGIDATTRAIERLTAAEKENAKSAKDSADFFKSKLKPLNEAKDQEAYLAGLTKEAKELGSVEQAATKAASSKKQLLDGVKKLGQEVPVLGYALNAIKNPFTAIAVVGLLAKKAVDDYAASIEKMAESVRNVTSAQGRIERYFEVIAQQKTGADNFAASMERLSKASQTTAQWLAEVNAQIDRQFELERKAAAQNETPEAAARRDFRQAAARVNALGNARRREERRADDLAAQVPGAREKETEAAIELQKLRRRSEDQSADDKAELARLKDQEQTIRDALAEPEGFWQDIGFGTWGSRRFFESPADARARHQAALEENIAARNRIEGSSSIRNKDLVNAEAVAARAASRRQQLEQDALAARDAARGFGAQERTAVAVADTGRPVQNNLGPGSAQFRYEAQLANLRNSQIRADGREAASLIAEALKSVVVPLSQELSDVRRILRGNSQNQQ